MIIQAPKPVPFRRDNYDRTGLLSGWCELLSRRPLLNGLGECLQLRMARYCNRFVRAGSEKFGMQVKSPVTIAISSARPECDELRPSVLTNAGHLPGNFTFGLSVLIVNGWLEISLPRWLARTGR